jgi:hypothetical protein
MAPWVVGSAWISKTKAQLKLSQRRVAPTQKKKKKKKKKKNLKVSQSNEGNKTSAGGSH